MTHQKNFKSLATNGIGNKTREEIQIVKDKFEGTMFFYNTNGEEKFGLITKVTMFGYMIMDLDTKEIHNFKFNHKIVSNAPSIDTPRFEQSGIK